MFISFRAARMRNVSVAVVNSSITLIILLIAPLGLAAVIINTLLVAIASYGVCQTADRIIIWLSPPPSITTSFSSQAQEENRSEVVRRKS